MDTINKEGAADIFQSSPRFFRRTLSAQINIESSNSTKGKVVLGEVEEKLKSMKQKRLDRLSTFVMEQSKLADNQSNSNNEKSEIEDAIISIKQTKENNKCSSQFTTEEDFRKNKKKILNEEIVSDNISRPRTPKLFRKFSNESVDKFKSQKSPSMKFISKFNCTTRQNVSSSIEDLTSDDDNNTDLISNKSNYYKSVVNDSHRVTNIIGNIPDNYNSLLSPDGKQRKGIYLYETECMFLENEKLAMRKEHEINNRTEEHKKVCKDSDIVICSINMKTVNYDGNIASETSKPSSFLTTFKCKSKGDLLDRNVVNRFSFNRRSADESAPDNNKINQSITKTEMTKCTVKVCEHSKVINADKRELEKVIVNNSNEKRLVQPKSPMPLPRKVYNMEVADTNEDYGSYFKFPTLNAEIVQQNKMGQFSNRNISEHQIKGKNSQVRSSPFPSSMSLPRNHYNHERILKKFQRNWDNLKEIVENDSDVDSDEMENLKKTLHEVNALVTEYKNALDKLEEKFCDRNNYIETLTRIRDQLKETKNNIATFKGLKRDISYRELNIKLLKYLIEINKIRCTNIEVIKERNAIVEEIERYLKILEFKVTKNENMLYEVMEAQVCSISTNIFHITRV